MKAKAFTARRIVTVLALLAVPWPGAAMAADCPLSPEAQQGQIVARQCQGCHEFTRAKPSRPTGPNLSAVYGARAGSVPDFTKYSEAMKAAASTVTWDEASLRSFLADPKAFLSTANGKDLRQGHFFTLKDEAKRADVARYMKELKACP